jgi:hypothetical protein
MGIARRDIEEWAYAKPYTSEDDRVAAFPIWLHTYNHLRGDHLAGRQDPQRQRA